MKKLLSILLAFMMVISIVGCSSNEPSSTPSNTEPQSPVIESAVDFYTEVWAAFGADNQFPASGGDADNAAEGPAKFALSEANADSFKHMLKVTDELYDMLDDDVATLQHMMNLNTFSSAVAKLKDPSKTSEFAEAYKTAIQGQRWMCGFPDKVVVISVGDYVVMAYGHEGNIDNLVAACSSVEEGSTVLVDDVAMIE